MELSPQWASVVDEITRRIVTTAQPQRILLFGSVARGQYNADSDLDLLVIVRGAENLQEFTWHSDSG
jgi:predicted nucleotidyltransferase